MMTARSAEATAKTRAARVAGEEAGAEMRKIGEKLQTIINLSARYAPGVGAAGVATANRQGHCTIYREPTEDAGRGMSKTADSLRFPACAPSRGESFARRLWPRRQVLPVLEQWS
jgi:hypothetical protein